MPVTLNPAVSGVAAKRIRAQIRSWRLHLRSGWSLKDLAREVNMTVRGWISYYGRFYPSALYPSLNRINDYLVRWIVQKYKRYRASGSGHLSNWERGGHVREAGFDG